MTTLHITRGLPGSGKTTFARSWVAEDPQHRARVNRDDLRTMLHAGQWHGHATEQQIVAARNAVIATLLGQGIDVLCDDTNLQQGMAKDLAKLARDKGAEWMVHDLSDVPLDECLRRDALRDAPVGEEPIRRMHQKFLAGRKLAPVELPEPTAATEGETYTPLPDLPPAILVDIDGTVALTNGRSPYDENRVGEDLPNLPVIAVAKALVAQGHALVFMSGRTDGCREATLLWLRQHFAGECVLFMRAAGDSRKDAIIKRELFDAHVRGQWRIACVLDDRNQVVDMWRAMGLTCLQVAPGNF